MLDRLGQLQIGFAVELPGQAQVREPVGISHVHIRRDTDVVNRVARGRVVTRGRQLDGLAL